MKVIEAPFKASVTTLLVDSTTAPEFVDITSRVKAFLDATGIQNGFLVVFSRHTTAAITIQENEPLLLNDMAGLLDRLAPRNARYGHNDFSIRTVHMGEEECPNGHSHCQHLTLGSSETIPVVDGVLALGQWQRIFMVELDDGKIGPREVMVQTLGV
jgi:secondary thiamine-phosphate synthase enzyme